MTDLELPILQSADPASDTLSAVHTPPPIAVPAWRVATVANLRDVEDLLDLLEAQGFAQREVVTLENNLFAVRWR